MLGFLERSRVGSRITRALRSLASAAATLLGVLLLVADSTDECAAYEPLTTAFDYSTDCALVGASGASGTGAVGGTSGVGASGSGSSGAAASPSVQTGRVTLRITSDPDAADGDAFTAMRTGNLDVASANVSYKTTGDCSGGQDGIATVRGVNVTLRGAGASEFQCPRLALPVRREQTVTCTQSIDAGANPATCTLTFSPLPR